MFEYENVATVVGEGELLSRKMIADRLNRKKTTTLIGHIERAVEAGLLHKAWCHYNGYSGWGYATPDTMPKLMEG